MSDDEQRSEHYRTPQERLEDVGLNTGTFDLPGPGDNAGRESGTAGLPDEDEVPQETLESIHTDRSQRLDPEHRPDGAEIDNTHRTFDAGAGMFTDNPEYDPNNRPWAGPGDPGPPIDHSHDRHRDQDGREPLTAADG